MRGIFSHSPKGTLKASVYYHIEQTALIMQGWALTSDPLQLRHWYDSLSDEQKNIFQIIQVFFQKLQREQQNQIIVPS